MKKDDKSLASPLVITDTTQTLAPRSIPTDGLAQHVTTSNSASDVTLERDVDTEILPPLHFSFRWTSILFYFIFLVFSNVLVPCLLFYLLKNLTSITTKELIGISSAALGISSCFDAPFRLYRLVRFRRRYGPLGSDVWWHLDFVMWTYTFALLVFAIPLAIAPAIGFYDFFLMSTTMLIGPIGVVILFSLAAFKLPCRCSSDPKGTLMKPAVFYAVEDMAAVDFKNGREFRVALHRRYAISPPFRRLIYRLTLYWALQCVIYCGITAAVTWGSPLNFAFGWVLGQLFLWMGVSAVGCVLLVKKGRRDEKEWWLERPRLYQESTSEKREERPRCEGEKIESTSTRDGKRNARAEEVRVS